MVYFPTNLPIKIKHSWIGKYTVRHMDPMGMEAHPPSVW